MLAPGPSCFLNGSAAISLVSVAEEFLNCLFCIRSNRDFGWLNFVLWLLFMPYVLSVGPIRTVSIRKTCRSPCKKLKLCISFEKMVGFDNFE